MTTIEYRVRPVTRYIITRYQRTEVGDLAESRSEVLGMFDNAESANKVCTVLSQAEEGAEMFPAEDPDTHK